MRFHLSASEQEQNLKLERLYKINEKKLLCIALQMLRNPMDAEDVVQDAFLRVADHLDQIPEEDNHRTFSYLAVIVKHIAIDVIRQHKREMDYSYEQLEALERTVKMDALGELYDPVLLQSLSLDSAETLQLKYVEGYSNAEIAKAFGISEAAVRQRIARAKKKIRASIRTSKK